MSGTAVDGQARTFTWLTSAGAARLIDEPIARRAGELGRRYRRSHPGLALADLLIAATALELGQPLATLNTRHFPMFPRLHAPH